MFVPFCFLLRLAELLVNTAGHAALRLLDGRLLFLLHRFNALFKGSVLVFFDFQLELEALILIHQLVALRAHRHHFGGLTRLLIDLVLVKIDLRVLPAQVLLQVPVPLVEV